MNIIAGLQRGLAVFSVLSGLPQLLGTLIQEAETLFPNAKSGAEKLAWVQKMVTSFLTFGGSALTDIEALLPTITLLINNIVAAAKGAAPPPVVAPPAP